MTRSLFSNFVLSSVAIVTQESLVLRRSPSPTTSLAELISFFLSPKRRPSPAPFLTRGSFNQNTIPSETSAHVASIPWADEPAAPPWRRSRHSRAHSGDSASRSRARRRSLPSSALPPSASRTPSTTSLASLRSPSRPRKHQTTASPWVPSPPSSVSLSAAAVA